MGIVELPINILYLILTYFRGTYGASFTQNRTVSHGIGVKCHALCNYPHARASPLS